MAVKTGYGLRTWGKVIEKLLATVFVIEWLSRKEHLQENKMRAWKGKGIGKEGEGKGKARDDKGKGKKGQRWSNRTWGQAPAEAETGQAK